MTEEERVDSSFSGSICISLFYTSSKLICANVGGSRYLIGKFDGNKCKSKNLSRDQKPSEQDELDRIIKMKKKMILDLKEYGLKKKIFLV